MKSGQRVKFNADGIKWAYAVAGAPRRSIRVTWEGRLGTIRLRMDGKTGRVMWDGNKSYSDPIQLKLLEHA